MPNMPTTLPTYIYSEYFNGIVENEWEIGGGVLFVSTVFWSGSKNTIHNNFYTFPIKIELIMTKKLLDLHYIAHE